ncbi:hypothetical protein ACFQZZ_01300 [Nocardia sp. GCM10030253]|uniref:hypothetical protein n=1 Tax=Nocardia sp. GCM10030253 TaxID=3273404 RepID=UPI0036453006
MTVTPQAFVSAVKATFTAASQEQAALLIAAGQQSKGGLRGEDATESIDTLTTKSTDGQRKQVTKWQTPTTSAE